MEVEFELREGATTSGRKEKLPDVSRTAAKGGGKLEMRHMGRTNGRHVFAWHAWGSASSIHQCHHTGSGQNR